MASSNLTARRSLEWTIHELPERNSGIDSPRFVLNGVELFFNLYRWRKRASVFLKISKDAGLSSQSSGRRFRRHFTIEMSAEFKIGEDITRIRELGPIDCTLDQEIVRGVDISIMEAGAAELRFLFIFDRADDVIVPSLPKDTESKCVQTPPYLDTNFEIESLSEDLWKWRDGFGPIPDVELVCQGHTFHAHRSLLSLRSDVFDTMLSSDMTEGQTGRVNIADVDAEIFQQFLEYLYKGRLQELTPDTAAELYKLAKKYAVRALKTQCACYLADNLAPDNALDVLRLADLYDEEELKDDAMAYVVEKKIPFEGDSSDWYRFQNSRPLLALEVMTRICMLYRT